jgi:hypothetical protein
MSEFQDVLDDPQNHILASLPRSDYERLRPHLRLMNMRPGESLHEIGARLEHVHFPNSGMVSLVLTSAEGTNVEVGIVAREGMVGTATVWAAPRLYARPWFRLKARRWSCRCLS